MDNKSKGGVGAVLGGGAAGGMGPIGWVAGAKAGSNFASGKNPLSGTFLDNSVDVPGAMARPEWSLSGADGKLRPDLLLGSSLPKAAGQSQGVLDTLVGRATAEGPSASAKYLMEANTRNTNNSLDQAEALGKSTAAGVTSNLAMRGGLDSGSRERIGRSTGLETMMNKQRILNDSQGSNLDILAKDEAGKTQMMQALPASLLAQAGYEQGNRRFDIENTLNTVGGKYNADMQAWGANQAAREQAQLANKNKGALGLGFMGL